MSLNQRTVTIALLLVESILAGAGLIYLALLGVDQTAQRGLLLLIPLLLLLTVAAVRGWRWTGLAMVGLSSLITVTLLIDPLRDPRIVPIIFVPMALALVVTTAQWTLGTGLAVIAVAVARSGGQGAYARFDALLVYLFVLICIYLGRLILERAQGVATAALEAAETARQAAEAAAQTADERATIIQARAADQERLLATVAVLETPAIAVAPGVLLAPIVGIMDDRRAAALTERLLRSIAERRIATLILDITGMAASDDQPIERLTQLTRAVQLLGAQVIISGISAALARQLADAGTDLGAVRTVPTPYDALALIQSTAHGPRTTR